MGLEARVTLAGWRVKCPDRKAKEKGGRNQGRSE